MTDSVSYSIVSAEASSIKTLNGLLDQTRLSSAWREPEAPPGASHVFRCAMEVAAQLNTLTVDETVRKHLRLAECDNLSLCADSMASVIHASIDGLLPTENALARLDVRMAHDGDGVDHAEFEIALCDGGECPALAQNKVRLVLREKDGLFEALEPGDMGSASMEVSSEAVRCRPGRKCPNYYLSPDHDGFRFGVDLTTATPKQACSIM